MSTPALYQSQTKFDEEQVFGTSLLQCINSFRDWSPAVCEPSFSVIFYRHISESSCITCLIQHLSIKLCLHHYMKEGYHFGINVDILTTFHLKTKKKTIKYHLDPYMMLNLRTSENSSRGKARRQKVQPTCRLKRSYSF